MLFELDILSRLDTLSYYLIFSPFNCRLLNKHVYMFQKPSVVKKKDRRDSVGSKKNNITQYATPYPDTK